MNKRILFIDDDPNLLNAMRRKLHNSKYGVFMANSGESGLQTVKTNPPFAVVVCDMRMPGMDGVRTLEEIAKLTPNSSRIMLTGNADQQTAIEAVNTSQIFRFLTKPCPDAALMMALEAGTRQYQLVTAERELLQKTLAGSIKVLTDVMALVMPEAFDRGGVTREWLQQLAPKLDEKNLWAVEIAALISRIGFVTVPNDIQEKIRLNKPLNAVGQQILSQVPLTASKLIRNLPRMDEVATTVEYQWKGFDGSGVPTDDVKGEDIPRGARILRILSDLAAVTKGSFPNESGIGHLLANKHMYDPALLEIVTTHFAVGGEAERTIKGNMVLEYLRLRVSALRPGDLLVSDICREDGQLLLAKGMRLSEIQIDKLRNLAQITTLCEPIEVERQIKMPENSSPLKQGPHQ
jgi:response regulator RpfG family c-di-GMP phosphodiesterase